ncbi:MAG TPA: hypothetical protein VIP75_08985, partial [Acidothermales bacterium]
SVGRVLRELDDKTIAVPTEGVVLLGVGIFAEPGRRGCPRREDAFPDRSGRERVGVGQGKT